VTNEDLFLGGLLQDVGMLALARAMPEVYRGVRPLQADHGRVQSLETEALGIDHAQVGAWLLGRWDLPARWVTAVASSHDLVSGGDAESGDALSRCVAAAGAVADIWCSEHLEEATDRAAETCGRLLGTDNAELEGILRLLGTEMREGAEVFDVDIGDALLLESVSENARELLTTRTLQAEQAVLDLRQKASSLESRTRELEEANRRDKLTGLYNRGHLDQVLREEFAGARARGWPLSLVFVDLDHFKRVNDAHGHSAGDVVIKHAADILTESTRTADVVARYGGEEFVLLLVGTGRQGARRVCERVVGAFRGTAVTVEPSGTAIRVTASVGLAVQGEGVQYESAEDLLRAADGALYEAKNSVRDRMVCVGG
jgi:diguanylate cyclase (GGDEF)-like protein